MDITVYLPDEIGERAKEAGLNLSGLLRSAVIEELERSEKVSETLKQSRTYEVAVVDEEGRPFTGRITGALIAKTENDIEVYLTEDERVIVVDDEGRHWELGYEETYAEQLRPWLEHEPGEYADALRALGQKPVIDL